MSVTAGIFAGLVVALGLFLFSLRQEEWVLKQKYPKALDSSERYVLHARELIHQGDYAGAAQVLDRLFGRKGDQPGVRADALLLLGKSLERSASDPASMARAREVREMFIQENPSDPRAPGAHLSIAENLARGGRYDESNERYERLMRMNTDMEKRGMIEFLIARNYYRAGAFHAAIDAMQQIRQKYEGTAAARDSMSAMTWAMVELDKPEEARRISDLLSTQAPGSPQAAAAMLAMAEAATKSGDYEAAIDYCMRWLKESPVPQDQVKIMLLLGSAKLKAGSPEEAVAIAFDITGLTTDLQSIAEAAVLRGKGLEALSQLEEAEASYVEAGRIAPEWSSPYVSLARLYWSKGELPEAIEYMERACRAAPLNDSLFMDLAKMYRQNDKKIKAIDILDEFTRERQLSVHIKEATFLLADIQLEMNRPQSAYRTLDRLLGLGTTDTEDAAVYERQADILARIGLYDDAFERYRMILDVGPGSRSIRFKAARAILDAGKPELCLDELSSIDIQTLPPGEKYNLHNMKARAYLDLEMFSDARRSIQNAMALRTKRENYSTLALLMHANMALQDDRAASQVFGVTLKLMEDIVAEAPHEARNIVLDWALRLYEQGRYDDAAKAYSRIQIPTFPADDVAWALYQQGNCYRHDADYEKAGEAYARLATEYPDSEWIQFALQGEKLIALRPGI